MKVKDIADILDGEVDGDPEHEIKDIAPVDEVDEDTIAVLRKEEDWHKIKKKAGAVVIPPNVVPDRKLSYSFIRVKNTEVAFVRLVELFYPREVPQPSISPMAYLGEVKLGKNVHIGAYTWIGDAVEIGDRTVVHPFVYIAGGTKIGANTVIYPGVVIYPRVTIGSNVVIHSGTIIGSPGFGYVKCEDGWLHIPQVGGVVIEDDVHIGANVTIDSGTLRPTRIGKGVKIDNLVQIAHNVKIGENTVIAAQTGIAGSSELGNWVVLGGQVGITDHVKLGDGVMVAAQSGVTKSAPPNTKLFGYPAREYNKARRTYAILFELPQIARKVKELEKRLKEREI